jgi:hypothetical protein
MGSRLYIRVLSPSNRSAEWDGMDGGVSVYLDLTLHVCIVW